MGLEDERGAGRGGVHQTLIFFEGRIVKGVVGNL